MTPLALALLAAAPAAPTPTPAALPATVAVRFGVPAERHPVPFEWLTDHVLFQVEVAGRTVWALLDNGAVHSVVDAGVATAAGLVAGPADGISYTTGGHYIARRYVPDVAVAVPGNFATRMPLMVVDLAGASRAAGRPIGAVIGHDVLSAMPAVVDRERRTLLITPGSFAGGGGARAVPLIRAGDLDQVDARIGATALRLTIDTGLEAALGLPPATWVRVRPPGAAVTRRATTGASGVRDVEQASTVPALTLGETEVRDLDVRISPWPARFGDGVIGMGLLARSSFVLDIPAGKLWLLPPPTPTPAPPPPPAR